MDWNKDKKNPMNLFGDTLEQNFKKIEPKEHDIKINTFGDMLFPNLKLLNKDIQESQSKEVNSSKKTL